MRIHQSRVCSIQPGTVVAQVEQIKDTERTDVEQLPGNSRPDPNVSEHVCPSPDYADNDDYGYDCEDMERNSSKGEELYDDEYDVPTYIAFFELSSSVLSFLDNQHRVADDVFTFYDSLNNSCDPMVPHPVTIPQTVTPCPHAPRCS